MQQLRPVPVSHKTATKPFLHQGLDTCTHVWLQEKPIRPALTLPYTGPHKVISRIKENRTFNVEVNGRTKTVSIERLKPAFTLQEDHDGSQDDAPEPITPPSSITVQDTPKPSGILKPSLRTTPTVSPRPLTHRRTYNSTRPFHSTSFTSTKVRKVPSEHSQTEQKKSSRCIWHLKIAHVARGCRDHIYVSLVHRATRPDVNTFRS